jgi:hypothetical protein
MDQLRHLPRTIVLPALLAIAAVCALAVAHSDRLSDVLDAGAFGSLASVAIGLTVAVLVLSRVSPRR